MKVRVLYFAALREQLGCGSEALEVPPDIASVEALRDYLMRRGDAWQDGLSGKRPLRVAVNQDLASPDHPLREGDEVAFFPPVTGG